MQPQTCIKCKASFGDVDCCPTVSNNMQCKTPPSILGGLVKMIPMVGDALQKGVDENLPNIGGVVGGKSIMSSIPPNLPQAKTINDACTVIGTLANESLSGDFNARNPWFVDPPQLAQPLPLITAPQTRINQATGITEKLDQQSGAWVPASPKRGRRRY